MSMTPLEDQVVYLFTLCSCNKAWKDLTQVQNMGFVWNGVVYNN
jgi:hypothetical protein